ncbi:hypothetical protein GCM10010174_51250 [Kutzneria viridogrisea]|uniref:Asp23/Gls24 family envelope stress response protein n=2 Tax=Kutzneria TaxID=43356 RepID=W5WCQ2_9PSEU|nr:Asp23/Gls24 family envelope stress response protein [Kutzneria albida]AHH95999.1 hypothetical protein KALB_2631 [Kutzneria albida DSM 43870]MBA8928799.1 putative alkaline shock family protein YloU [Kutzneria viridogrisea]
MSAGDPEERGSLRIDPSVVRKLAEHAADLAPGTARAGRRGASAKVSGSGNEVDLRLELGLSYPAQVRETVAAVREQVSGEVQRLTGYRVRSVDVVVSALLAAPISRNRVE